METIDDCSAKFRVNGEFVSTIFVTYGAIVCLRTVTDYIDIDGVPTKVTYWEVDNGITLKRLDSGNGRLFFTDKYENYAEVQLPSPMYYSNNVIIDDDYEMEIEINTLNNDIFENSIMVNEYI